MASWGREFFKLTGSGNDFVFFDARTRPPGELCTPPRIDAICARGTGVGADGVVLLEQSTQASFRIRYFNRDGSLASLCGNASLCSVRLAVELGAAPPTGFQFETDAGILGGRIRDGLPEIDLQPVSRVDAGRPDIEPEPGGGRLGFAEAGVPHLVLLCDDVGRIDVVGRGAPLRRHPALPHGANVNFLSRQGSAWAMRTYERGVEAETLACGTGAVASAILLASWGEAPAAQPIEIRTRSGEPLTVTLRRDAESWHPSLRGEGRIVFRGELGEV